ncbi:hypothetical protein POJ06DRAFT_114059 [Lipomyces tetrasporus]|uniref:RhoGAP-domain-containing protein n=1 Tax=Lipomyces tetrasporus TaxID=54092 RepID=A0AAD7VR72_9ASCO|nr:uncharacterized protein POJ06DRAFT_114059 [Lipomyces tetrasporus]KAJ8099652.1 hypothetical protein POJ06DRAFT_114059 [Lipomyces tetrasporus]
MAASREVAHDGVAGVRMTGDVDISRLLEQNTALHKLVSDQQATISEWKARVTQASKVSEHYKERLLSVESERDQLREAVNSLEGQLRTLSTRDAALERKSTERVNGHLASEDELAQATHIVDIPTTSTVAAQARSSVASLNHSEAEMNLAALCSPDSFTDRITIKQPANTGTATVQLEDMSSSRNSLDAPTTGFAKAINYAFGSSDISLSLGNGSSSSYTTAGETESRGSPILSSLSEPVPTVVKPTAIEEKGIAWSEVQNKQKDGLHSRTASSAFSFETTAQDEYAIQWATRADRNSTSSIEYVDDYGEEDEKGEDESQMATPTLESIGGLGSDSLPQPSTSKLTATEFPKRVQSYFPTGFAGRTSSVNTGLGVAGIEDRDFPVATNSVDTDSAHPPSYVVKTDASPRLGHAYTDDNSSKSPQSTEPNDSPVYFPPSSPATLRSRSSTVPATVIFSPQSAGSYYENAPILQPTSVLLITAESLPTIAVSVVSSRVRNLQKVKSKLDDPIIILSIRDRSTDKEWWKISKVLSSLVALDSTLRTELGNFVIPRLPDRTLFASLAPSKVDMRRKMLEDYFSAVMSIPALHDDKKAAVLFGEFLSTDIIDPMAMADTGVRKEGYLTKRGKNFGGWKMRYFVLDSPELQYYEIAGGAHLGTIRLDLADIIKQDTCHETEDSKIYRHSFQILERKRQDSVAVTKHILCAENDDERDDWVDALQEFVEPHAVKSSDAHSIVSTVGPVAVMSSSSSAASVVITSPKKKLPIGLSLASSMSRKKWMEREKTDTESTVGYGEYAQSNKSSSSFNEQSPSPPGSATSVASTSAPSSVHFNKGLPPAFPQSHEWSNAEERELEKDLKKQKKRSFFSLKKDPWSDRSPSPSPTPMQLADQVKSQQQHQLDNRKFLQLDFDSFQQSPIYEYRASVSRPFLTDEPVNRELPQNYDDDEKYKGEIVRGGIKSINSTIVVGVFGITLAQAIEISYIAKGEVKLPSVVYRCIEYLDSKDAAKEEGIFRLSGSSTVIRALKERFNTDADVNLVEDGVNYDVHAVAGLLKLYLRELPTNVLTEDLKVEFVQSIEIPNRQSRLHMFYVLLRQLPPENYSLLKALSRFLIKIVDKSNQNKMNIRNIGIVFAPTLNISNALVQMFIADYSLLFIDRKS